MWSKDLAVELIQKLDALPDRISAALREYDRPRRPSEDTGDERKKTPQTTGSNDALREIQSALGMLGKYVPGLSQLAAHLSNLHRVLQQFGSLGGAGAAGVAATGAAAAFRSRASRPQEPNAAEPILRQPAQHFGRAARHEWVRTVHAASKAAEEVREANIASRESWVNIVRGAKNVDPVGDYERQQREREGLRQRTDWLRMVRGARRRPTSTDYVNPVPLNAGEEPSRYLYSASGAFVGAGKSGLPAIIGGIAGGAFGGAFRRQPRPQDFEQAAAGLRAWAGLLGRATQAAGFLPGPGAIRSLAGPGGLPPRLPPPGDVIDAEFSYRGPWRRPGLPAVIPDVLRGQKYGALATIAKTPAAAGDPFNNLSAGMLAGTARVLPAILANPAVVGAVAALTGAVVVKKILFDLPATALRANMARLEELRPLARTGVTAGVFAQYDVQNFYRDMAVAKGTFGTTAALANETIRLRQMQTSRDIFVANTQNRIGLFRAGIGQGISSITQPFFDRINTAIENFDPTGTKTVTAGKGVGGALPFLPAIAGNIIMGQWNQIGENIRRAIDAAKVTAAAPGPAVVPIGSFVANWMEQIRAKHTGKAWREPQLPHYPGADKNWAPYLQAPLGLPKKE